MDAAQQIELYRRQYFQLIDPQHLAVPHLDVLRLPQVQEEIYSKMFSGESVPFLPPPRFRFRVLKALIDILHEGFQDPEEHVSLCLHSSWKFLNQFQVHILLPFSYGLCSLYSVQLIRSISFVQEISDSLTASFAQLVAQPSMSEIDSAQQKSYVTYTAPIHGSDAPSVTTLETRSTLASSGNTGIRTWEAALRLGTYLFSDAGRQHVAGMNIIELGAGTGFLSILCVKHLNARFVMATDGSGEVVDELQSSFFLNGFEGAQTIQARVLKWGHALIDGIQGRQEEPRSYQLVLGADVVCYSLLFVLGLAQAGLRVRWLTCLLIYDENSIPALVSTLREVFAQYEGAKAVISATLRNPKTLDTFMHACGKSSDLWTKRVRGLHL